MTFCQRPYLTSALPDMLTCPDIRTPHGMFNRLNGSSAAPFAEKNLSFGLGDEQDNVQQNRQQIKDRLGIEILVSAKQEHGGNIYCTENITCDIEVEGFDALITDRPGLGLMIQQADCQAVLLHDPQKKVVAAIHCGWRGSVLNIIDKTICCMMEKYRTNPTDLRAVISPSLGPCCAEFIHYRKELPSNMHALQPKPDHFDFWQISTGQLIESGVPRDNIAAMKICTACNNEFFSYRRSTRKGKPTGRQGSIILLSS